MKALLIILFLLLCVPLAFTGASFAIELGYKGHAVALFGRCVNGRVMTGAGLMWR